MIRVDQSPLGNSPSSNPATCTGVFDLIRQLFAELPDAAERRFTARTFSFNVSGGRCETCEGSGQLQIEMHFLPDVWVPCDDCHSKRYNEEVLEIKLHGRWRARRCPGDALRRSGSNCAPIARRLRGFADDIRCRFGLRHAGPIGADAFRWRGSACCSSWLPNWLARLPAIRSICLMNRPPDCISTTLPSYSVCCSGWSIWGTRSSSIEHNLDVIKCADWIIDMGPGAGVDGGTIVFAGTPEELAATAGTLRGKPASGKRAARNAPPKKLLPRNSPAKNSAAATVSVTAPFLADALSAPTQASKLFTATKQTSTKQTTSGKLQQTDAARCRQSQKANGCGRGSLGVGCSAAIESENQYERGCGRSLAGVGTQMALPGKGFPDNQTPDWPLELADRV